MQLGDSESYSYGATSSTSSLTNSYCARLTSSSPPESFAYSYRLPLAARASSKSPRPAVLTVSDVEISVEDVQPLSPATGNTHRAQNRECLPNDSENIQGHHHCCSGGCACRGGRNSPSVTRICSLLLGLSLLVFGGIMIPVSWFVLIDNTNILQQDEGGGDECKTLHTRLQFAFISQGLLLSLTGIILIGCWRDEDRTTLENYRRYLYYTHPTHSSLILTAIIIVSYCVLLGSLGYIVWQFLTTSINCQWPPAVYSLLVPLEGLAALISAISTGTITVLTVCRNQ